MIAAVIILAVGLVLALLVVARMLVDERQRTADLLGLLEAKAAPEQYAAYVAPPVRTTDETIEYLSSDDGLIVVEAD